MAERKGKMPGLILEGGTFRAIFSAGCMDALLAHHVMFPYCIGVSAGITDAFSYISRQKGRNLDMLVDLRHDKRYVGKRNFLKSRSLFGLDFAYDTVPNQLYPFDWETFYQYKGKILVGVTNAETGEAEYMDGRKLDKRCMMLRATCAIPLLFPEIEIDGKIYYDGGLRDPIPIRRAIEDGNKKNLILLTRPKGYRKELNKSTRMAAAVLKKKYPKLYPLFLTRHMAYNKTVEYCERLEAEGRAVILRPSHPIESLEKDVAVIRANYEMGYTLAEEKVEEIKALWR